MNLNVTNMLRVPENTRTFATETNHNAMTTLHITSLDTIRETACRFIDLMGERRVFAFNGPMGAGKTTFIRAICHVLGVQDTVNSPTFSIVNEYETADGRTIYHFDCYRINRVQEALDLGAEEYLYSGCLCFIEWAENIAPLLPDTLVNVNIEVQDDGRRTVQVE